MQSKSWIWFLACVAGPAFAHGSGTSSEGSMQAPSTALERSRGPTHLRRETAALGPKADMIRRAWVKKQRLRLRFDPLSSRS